MNRILNLTISAGLLATMVGFVGPVTAATVEFADPQLAGPSYPGCLDTGATGDDGGISYEWTVSMHRNDQAHLVYLVGAKSWNEPPPAYEPPDTGWTHTSNWIALELKRAARLTIVVERQEGVAYQGPTGTVVARNKLVPAVSVYKGWDNTSCEDHRYNNSGNDDWSTLEYIGNKPNEHGHKYVVYKVNLRAGRYSIAIGGSPAELKTYPAGNCDPADPVCYAYTGQHGFEAHLKTKPL